MTLWNWILHSFYPKSVYLFYFLAFSRKYNASFFVFLTHFTNTHARKMLHFVTSGSTNIIDIKCSVFVFLYIKTSTECKWKKDIWFHWNLVFSISVVFCHSIYFRIVNHLTKNTKLMDLMNFHSEYWFHPLMEVVAFLFSFRCASARNLLVVGLKKGRFYDFFLHCLLLFHKADPWLVVFERVFCYERMINWLVNVFYLS